jgi:hypothetical protein
MSKGCDNARVKTVPKSVLGRKLCWKSLSPVTWWAQEKSTVMTMKPRMPPISTNRIILRQRWNGFVQKVNNVWDSYHSQNWRGHNFCTTRLVSCCLQVVELLSLYISGIMYFAVWPNREIAFFLSSLSFSVYNIKKFIIHISYYVTPTKHCYFPFPCSLLSLYIISWHHIYHEELVSVAQDYTCSLSDLPVMVREILVSLFIIP